MTARLVVHFATDGALSAKLTKQLCEQGLARGGQIVRWSGSAVAFAFALDAELDAIEWLGEEDLAGLRVAVAQGELETVVETRMQVELAVGDVLVRAERLAEMAKRGEAILDAKLAAVQERRLLWRSSRLAPYGRGILRGLVLDVRRPLRSQVARDVERLRLDEEFHHFSLPATALTRGSLTLVQLPDGMPFRRLVSELHKQDRCRWLELSSPAVGEPLGALRRAFDRATAEETVPDLEPELEAAMRSLLSGGGIQATLAAQLVCRWLEVGQPGLLVLDGIEELDQDSLDVIAAAAQQGSFSLVACCAPSSLPTDFSELPRNDSIEFSEWSAEQAQNWLQRIAHEQLSPELARRFARLGMNDPPAMAEALAFAIETGDVVWEDQRVDVRRRRAARGRPCAVRSWLEERVRVLGAEERTVLAALGVLGGEATREELAGLVAQLDDAPMLIEAVLQGLEARHWLHRTGASLISFASRAHRDVLLSQLSQQQLKAFHRAAASMLSEEHQTLTSAAAAVHSVLAGNAGKALLLAKKAAMATRAVSLDATSEALESFAVSAVMDAIEERRLNGCFVWEAAPQSCRVVTKQPLSDRAPASSRVPWAEQVVLGPAATLLQAGDFDAVEQLCRALQHDVRRQRFVERLRALAELQRGDSLHARRRLEQLSARAHEADAGAAERSRILLASAIARERSGHFHEALLEALQALARAKEARDSAGERACRRWLQLQCERHGASEAARSWA